MMFLFSLPSCKAIGASTIKNLRLGSHSLSSNINGILLPKLVWRTVRKTCVNDRFEGWNVSIMFEPEYFFNLFLEVSQILYIRIIQIQIGKKIFGI